MSKILNYSTKAGQSKVASANKYKGKDLRDIYKTYSKIKENAYYSCLSKAINTENYQNDFHISGANCHSFSVAWTGEHNGHSAVFLETAENSYIVLLDR